MQDWHVRQAARAMHHGGVIAYPTEAVWGLGCDPYNLTAVQHLLAMKRRPMHKGLILVASDTEQIAPLLANLTEEQRQKVLATWPGPVTWVLPDPDDIIPSWIKGKHSSVAVRVSAHLGVKALCEAFDSFVVSTSANYASQEPARDKLKVNINFRCDLAYVLPGELGSMAQPTQIRSLETDALLRS
ncbi:Sua5/YciO/YrdC/YwlC family protein [Aliamphritea spongicola]|uniref:Sua5/YciO/YrdC/YwlC family protein n=1 Tax=Aliamphritea spongicola TaxID=707589 RepID=UPI00196A2026|nr:Sua5/YciO/YrdC/YwlC family protein [Aliamphritea spongicola]MBN3562023.1 Sua5/YciO/YrdC/YwlC family protein [Aliamphritea spongicola]